MASSDENLVSSFIAATSDYGLRKAGEFVDVSHETVRRWRAGDVAPLQPDTRRALKAFLESGDVTGGGYGSEGAAPQFFRSLDESLAHFRGIAPPGTAQARKRLAWESLTDAAKHFGWPIPDDWYEIPQMIDDGKV